MAGKRGHAFKTVRSSRSRASNSSDSSGTLTPNNSAGSVTPTNSPTAGPSRASGHDDIIPPESRRAEPGRDARLRRTLSDPYILSHRVAGGSVERPAAKRVQPSWVQETQSGPSRFAYNPLLRSQYNFVTNENRGSYPRRRGSFSNDQSNRQRQTGDPKAGILDDDNLLLVKEQVIRHTETIKCPPASVKDVERDRFNLIKGDKLGSGAYGSAYIGRKVGSDQKLAIKIYDAMEGIPYKMADLDESGNRGKGARNALIESLHEIMVMKALKGHPYVIQYVDHFIINEMIYLVMELGDDTLEGQVESYENGLSESKARKWFHEIAKGITFMHEIGIVHRDLKPDNILIKRLGFKMTIARISDFGRSRFLPHASVEIKGHSRVGMVRARTVARVARRDDPHVRPLRDMRKIPRPRSRDRRVFDDTNLLQDEDGYEAVTNDVYDLGITLLYMFGVGVDDISDQAYEIQSSTLNLVT